VGEIVCILESLDGEHFYIGITDDVPARLIEHNAGEVPHTSKYRPWRVRTYIAFTDKKACHRFREISEVRLERAFAKRRL
jgi:predicted GIY-YIG superfamily endonuclease